MKCGAVPPAHAVTLAWSIISLFSVVLFMFVPPRGPFWAVLLNAAGYMILPSVSVTAIAAVGGIVWLTNAIFTAQSLRHKPWVVKTLKTAFEELGEPPACLSDELKELVHQKRTEFLNECNQEGTYPGNIYITGKFRKHKRFIATWEHIWNVSISPFCRCPWHSQFR